MIMAGGKMHMDECQHLHSKSCVNLQKIEGKEDPFRPSLGHTQKGCGAFWRKSPWGRNKTAMSKMLGKL